MSAVRDELRLRQGHKRARYARDDIHAVLDAGYIATISFIHDNRPVGIPMMYWREGEYLYWHGSTKSRAMLASEGDDVCITVAHLDGLVLARSAFHHSANYRSVMIFGVAEKVPDTEKVDRLRSLLERIAPGRDEHLRPMSAQELKATLVLRVPITRVSAKIRSGPPEGDPQDRDWPVWEGVIPIQQKLGMEVSAGRTVHDEVTPDHVAGLRGRVI